MRVVVVGASGNIGTSLLESLAAEDAVDSILGLARRLPEADFPKAEWARADIESDELEPYFRGADAVVHLAWRIQPSHDPAALSRTNVYGSARLFRAVAAAGVPALVYASSVAVYSRGPKQRLVDETWPRDGIRTSFYGRHKAEVERLLDRFEREHPAVRVARMRPALVFKREAASEVRRLFLGPFLPRLVFRRGLVPFVPDNAGLRFQAVHSLDVGEAFRLALVRDVRGPFNLAADPILDGPTVAGLLGTRPVRVPAPLLRSATALTWRLHLQPTPAGWLDLALGVPLLDTARAASELGWRPRRSAAAALLELVEGIGAGAGLETPPLSPRSGGPARLREVATGVGSREH